MSFPEFVVIRDSPVAKHGGRRLGNFRLMWAEKKPGNLWAPHELAQKEYRLHLAGRVVLVATRWSGDFKFIELTAGMRRWSVAWCDVDRMYRKRADWRASARLQRFYDRMHNYVEGRTDVSALAGFAETELRERPEQPEHRQIGLMKD